MRFSNITFSSVLIGVAIATPLTNVARQEQDIRDVVQLGALPAPSELQSSLARRNGGGNWDDSGRGGGDRGDGDSGDGDRGNSDSGDGGRGDGQGGFRGNFGQGRGDGQGGSPGGSGEGRGRDDGDGRNQWTDYQGGGGVIVVEPKPASPPPPPAQQQSPPPSPPAQQQPPLPPASPPASPWADNNPSSPAAHAPAGDQPTAPSVLPEEVRAWMMPMVWKLGCITPLQSGVGSMGMVLPRVNTVDQGKKPGSS